MHTFPLLKTWKAPYTTADYSYSSDTLKSARFTLASQNLQLRTTKHTLGTDLRPGLQRWTLTHKAFGRVPSVWQIFCWHVCLNIPEHSWNFKFLFLRNWDRSHFPRKKTTLSVNGCGNTGFQICVYVFSCFSILIPLAECLLPFVCLS